MGRSATVLFGCLLVAFAGCQRGAEKAVLEPLETEEVGAAIDAAVTTEFDIQARSSQESVGAKMPADFPRDIPLYGSATVINYGPAAADRHFVEFSIPAQPGTVEGRYNAQIQAAGWQRGTDGEFLRGNRRIVVTYRQGTPGTWVRVEYPT